MTTTALTVDLPAEPGDLAVVLDRDALAWQRRDDLAIPGFPEARWFRSGADMLLRNEPCAKSWPHLLVDRYPLAPMVAVSAVDDYLAEPAAPTE